MRLTGCCPARLRQRAQLAVLALLMLAAPAGRAEWFSEQQSKMGTRVEIQLWHEDAAEAQRLVAAGMAELDRIEAAMSTYRDDSELSLVNREAAARPVPVSPELYALIERSLALSAQTHGAFDITYDSVGYLYDFRARERPAEAAISARLAAVDYRKLELEPAARTLRFAQPGMRLNLGGIAKGYACERVSALLRAAGVQHALANAGGDTRLLGDRRGRPWLVGIRDPDDEQGVVTRLALEDEAISTSGDYERYFDEEGVRYHHILDPSTGKSVTGIRSVTVVGPDATLTDGLSTSLFVLGVERGLELIDTLPDYEAVIVDSEHGVHVSKGLAD